MNIKRHNYKFKLKTHLILKGSTDIKLLCQIALKVFKPYSLSFCTFHGQVANIHGISPHTTLCEALTYRYYSSSHPGVYS